MSPRPQSSFPVAARLVSLDGPRTLGDAAAAIARKLTARSPTPVGSHVLRVQSHIEAIEPLAWLASRRENARFYWASRDSSLALAGCGVALRCDADRFDDLPQLVAATPGDLRLLITARHNAAGVTAPEWRAFGAVRAYLPRLELGATSTGCWLACHVVLGRGDDADEVAAALAALTGTPRVDTGQRNGPVRARSVAPMESAWHGAVDAVLAEIGRGTLHKVVLARRQAHCSAAALDPIELLTALAARHPQTFRFCVQPEPGVAFVGASPELLYRRDDSEVFSEAIAGTRPRGGNASEDDALRDELLADAKERREHRFVCEHIGNELSALTGELRVAVTDVVRLDNVQHLRTQFRGRLRHGTRDADLFARLHPTPAVCGWPAASARALIAANEEFDRGLYTGVVGWIGANAAECAVAIRCGLLRGDELHLYAGAGIVAGSNAHAEWREIDSKLRAFAAVLEATP